MDPMDQGVEAGLDMVNLHEAMVHPEEATVLQEVRTEVVDGRQDGMVEVEADMDHLLWARVCEAFHLHDPVHHLATEMTLITMVREALVRPLR